MRTQIVRPIEDRVLVLPESKEEVLASGIIVPENVRKKTRTGLVVACGPGKRSEVTGKTILHDLEAGDRVWFDEYAGAAVVVDGTEHFMLRAEECLAKEPLS